jgi:hypothetical protein
MGKVGIASYPQQERHGVFVSEGIRLAGRSRYALAMRYSDGGAGKRRHRSRRIGGKGK